MKYWIGIVGAFLLAVQAHAQNDPTSGTAFYPSCLAAADIIQGKRPATDSEDAAKQLRQASACFGAVTAIMKLTPLLKTEFAMCPPSDIVPDSKGALAQMVLFVTAYLKNHPEQRANNFHQTAVNALVAAWPCPQIDAMRGHAGAISTRLLSQFPRTSDQSFPVSGSNKSQLFPSGRRRTANCILFGPSELMTSNATMPVSWSTNLCSTQSLV